MKNTALFPAAVAALCAVAIWPLAGTTAPDQNARRIQIDPDTGEIVKPSAGTTPQSATGDTDQPARRTNPDSEDGSRAWTTDDGVQMVTPDPDDAPTAQATACPDGSLHIGDATPHKDGSAQEALCAEENN